MARPVLEWVSAAVGAALVAGTLGAVALQAAGHDEDAPPELHIEVSSPVRSGSWHLVRITVSNASSTTAAGVVVEARLMENDRPVETSRVTFDYVARGSAVRGGLWFQRDPAGYTLTVQPVSYQEP